MQALFRAISLALVGLFFSSVAAVAATVFTQANCVAGNNFCTSINSSTTFPRTVRSFTFNAPSAGRAVVTLTGSMVCDNAPNASYAIVDLITQITTSGSGAPVVSPGGMRLAETMYAPALEWPLPSTCRRRAG